MVVSTTAIEAVIFEAWLGDMDCAPRRVVDPNSNWRFDLAFPPSAPHQMSVLNPKKPSRAVVIVSAAMLAPEHFAAYEGLDEDAKMEFGIALQEALNRDRVDYSFQGVGQTLMMKSSLVCPTGFQVMSVIWDDGLSLDALAQALSRVYKAELAGIWCVNRHLGLTNNGSSGQFDFKRLGIQ